MSSMRWEATGSHSRTSGLVLVLDDVQDEMEILAEAVRLGAPAARVAGCTTVDEAWSIIESEAVDVLVTDLLMPDREGDISDVGTRLLAELKTQRPEIDVVVMTGAESVREAVNCMLLGASHFLVKRPDDLERLPRVVAEMLMLRPSLRSRGFHCDNLILRYWSMLDTEPRASERGLVLENLTRLLLETCRGFVVRRVRARGRNEELDIVAENEGLDHFWKQFKPLVLVECKCLRAPVERKEFDAFAAKIARREQMSNLGIFVSPSGFTSGFQDVRRRGRDATILPIDGAGLLEWIRSTDRCAFIRQRLQDGALQ